MNFKKEILDSIKSLPAMSTTNKKILTIMGSDNIDIAEVVKLIQYDPALTTNVLKLVNSAYFSLQNDVTSIRQAVVLLGLNQVFRLVIAVSFSPLMNKPIAGYDLPSGGLWQHCVATAVCSETIAKIINNTESDVLFTASLLHDIGKIALSSYVDEYYNLIDDEFKNTGDSFEVIEKKLFGIDHAEVGAVILKNWGIPVSLYLPVLWHHKPDECTDETVSTIVDIVHLADSLCLLAGFGIGRDGLQYKPSVSVLKRLQIKQSMLESIISQTMTGMENLKEIFEI